LSVSTSESHGWTLAANDLQALGISSFVCLAAEYACAHLDGLSSVVLVVPVFELDVLEALHPQAQSTGTSALAVVIMAGVADHETNVAFGREFKPSSDVGCARDVDSVLDVGSKYAPSRPVGERVTAAVGEERGHDGSGIRVASTVSDAVDKYRAANLLRFWLQPGVLHLGASGIVVAGPFIVMTGRGQRHSGDQFSTDGAVELAPFLCSRPAVVSRETFAIADGCCLIAVRAHAGRKSQHGKGGLDSKHDR
jgi:hypothetical protein